MPRNNKWRVYIKPFDDYGVYTDYVEVTDDVDFNNLGSISQDLDNTEFNIGIYRNNNVSLTFRNDSGRYSDVGSPATMFKYKRADSLVKITWAGEAHMKCGFVTAGNWSIAPEIDVFVGIINDDTLTMDADIQELTFTLLGRESILNRVQVNFDSLVVALGTTTVDYTQTLPFTKNSHGLVVGNPVYFTSTSSLPAEIGSKTPYYVAAVSTNTFSVATSLGGSALTLSSNGSGTITTSKLFGQSIQTLIRTILNQTPITALLTVSNGNIVVGTDCNVDSIVALQNKTVWQALGDLLLLSNSVLYVSSDAIIVSSRSAGSDISYYFYGQFSTDGPENVQAIKNISNGMNRVFNSLTWTPSATIAQNTSSVTKYGAKAKQFSQTEITNTTNQQTIFSSLLAEFALPKQEFSLWTPLKYGTLGIGLLNKISIDYPPMYIPGNYSFPICGIAICGEAVLPKALFGITLDPNDYYKVIGSEIDPTNALIKFRMRAV